MQGGKKTEAEKETKRKKEREKDVSHLPAIQVPFSYKVYQRRAPQIIDRRLDDRNRTRRYRKAKRREKVSRNSLW